MKTNRQILVGATLSDGAGCTLGVSSSCHPLLVPLLPAGLTLGTLEDASSPEALKPCVQPGIAA